MANGRAPIPAHIETTVRAIAKLHSEHRNRATRLQRSFEIATATVGRPAFLVILGLAVFCWAGGNLSLIGLGRTPLDPPPFEWLQGLIGLSALCMTILILTTQRRDDELTSRSEQLTLELAILSEQKSAKIIELLEESRRDDPHLPNRVDHHAAALSTAADPEAVLEAIQGSHDETASLS